MVDMVTKMVTWEDKTPLRPAHYAWKGELLSCERWALASADGSRVCEMECNGRGYTVDYLRFNADGTGSIRSFSALPAFDLSCRRIYTDACGEVIRDVLGWVNEWRQPTCGVDGGYVLSLDAWGNEVAV
jgi:hypothetical protein